MSIKDTVKKWPKEIWLGIFVILLTLFFMTVNNMPDSITGTHSISMLDSCEWDYLSDEFPAKEVISLELNDFFYANHPLEFIAFSHDGKVFLEDSLLVFFPEKEFSTVTIIAKNKEVSCSKTIKIIDA